MPKACPVCGAPVEHYTDYLDGHTLMEEYFTCQGKDKTHCGYSWGYAFGEVSARVGPFEFTKYYSPTTSVGEAILIDNQFKAACMAQRVVIMLLQSKQEATLGNLS